MKYVLALALLILAPHLADADPNAPAGRHPVAVLHNSGVPIGLLGVPLGHMVTVEGRRNPSGADGKGGNAGALVIDTINGKKLHEPLKMWVDNRELPPKFRFVLKGYEKATFVGLPPAVEQWAKETGTEFGQPQASWRLQLSFVALSEVVLLNDASLKSDPVAAIRSVLPTGWTIAKVEENAYPPNRPKGNGKAIFLEKKGIPRVGPPSVEGSDNLPAATQRAQPRQAGEEEEVSGAPVHVVVFIMPADYQDTDKVRARSKDRIRKADEVSHNPAKLLVEAPAAKIYWWPQDTDHDFDALIDDILLALFK